MLLRLAYLDITNAFALLRLLPGSDRDKDTEILALRHQLAVLQAPAQVVCAKVIPRKVTSCTGAIWSGITTKPSTTR